MYFTQTLSVQLSIFSKQTHAIFFLHFSSATVSDCGRYIFITVNDGCERNNLLYYADMEDINYKISGMCFRLSPVFTVYVLPLEKLKLTPILDKFEALFDVVTVDGRKVIVSTDLNAPMYKLIVVDLDNPARVSCFLDACDLLFHQLLQPR